MYLWLKALHIIFVITWLSAVFYLPRLFVYHAMSSDQISLERFKLMERKLYRGIMAPSAWLAVIFGAGMLWLNPAWLQGNWLHAKLALVLLLISYHLYCGKLLRDFREDRNRRSDVWLRWFNELPVFLLIGIVLLVVLKPF